MEEKKSEPEKISDPNSCDHHHHCCGGGHRCRFRCVFLVIILILACIGGEYVWKHYRNKENPSDNRTEISSVTKNSIVSKNNLENKNYDAQIEDIKNSVKNLETALHTLETQTQSTETQLQALEAQVRSIESQPHTPEAQVQSTEASLHNTLETQIRNVELQSHTLEIQLHGIESQLQTMEAEVKKLSDIKCPCRDSQHSAEENRKKWKTWMNLKNKMEKDEDFAKELELFYSAFADDAELIALVEDLAKGVDVVSSREEKGIIGTCSKYLRKIVRVKKINRAKLFEISGYVLSSTRKITES
ncbi:MAG: hypothetical protein LBB29_04100 [Holosporaceae bacterium]|jgi:chaperonin cofactor prefoldin|nr:hypothetical protein [Holosporaceae bacterium]